MVFSFVCFLAAAVLAIIMERTMEKKQKEAHEKVIELMKEGHDAEVCPKCKGRGGSFYGRCSECGGIGLNKEK